LDLEKERKDHQEKFDELDKKLKAIEEGGKKRIREFHKEIKEWKRNKEKLLEKIEHVEKKKEPLFVRLGKQTDETRENHQELSVFYSQIDRSNERIGELEQQIKNL
jgi:chromosome segregation ATPase